MSIPRCTPQANGWPSSSCTAARKPPKKLANVLGGKDALGVMCAFHNSTNYSTGFLWSRSPPPPRKKTLPHCKRESQFQHQKLSHQQGIVNSNPFHCSLLQLFNSPGANLVLDILGGTKMARHLAGRRRNGADAGETTGWCPARAQELDV